MPSIKRLLDRRKRTTHVYGDESGHLRSGRYFVLGVLLTRSPQRHESQLHQFRQETGYGLERELKYSSTDRCKVPYAERVIDYFSGEPDLRFRALVIPTRKFDLDYYDHLETEYPAAAVAYNSWYRRLIERNTPKRDELVLTLDDRTRANKDNMPEYIRREMSRIKQLNLVDSKRYQLVQMVDLFVGSLFGEATGTTQPVKRGLVEYLRDALGVGSLVRAEGKDFHVNRWRPPASQR